jgi:hypothetical protein
VQLGVLLLIAPITAFLAKVNARLRAGHMKVRLVYNTADMF